MGDELAFPAMLIGRRQDEFDEWFRRYAPLVLRTARRLTGSAQDAEDVAQDVFLKLHRHRERWSGGDPKSWLYRVTVNACLDRRKPGWLDETMPADAPAPPEDFTAGLEADRQKRLLELGLRHLAERERQAIVLRDIEGLPTAEVAGILDVEEVTVRSLTAQGRLKLKRFVDGYRKGGRA